jgi:hypothetical protein
MNYLQTNPLILFNPHLDTLLLSLQYVDYLLLRLNYDVTPVRCCKSTVKFEYVKILIRFFSRINSIT